MPQARDRLPDRPLQLVEQTELRRFVELTTEQLETHSGSSHRLDRVVVDVACDSLAFFLAGADEVLEQLPALGQRTLEVCCRLPLGDVADEGGQEPSVVRLDRAQGDVDGKLASVLP